MIEILVPYYMNREMLELQLDNWESWPPYVRKHTHITIVDDGSPEPLNVRDRRTLNLSIYRIQENIPWNIAGAKNLLATVCQADWFLMHDIDYLFPFEAFANIRQLDTSKPKRYYNFMVRNVTPPARLRESKIAFYMHRSSFWEVGGYNENLSGGWGLQASDLRRRLEKAGIRPNVEKDIVMLHYDLCDVSDANTTEWSRDSTENLAKFKQLDLAMPLNFEWECVDAFTCKD